MITLWGLGHKVDSLTEGKQSGFFLSASSQIASIHGQHASVMFLVLMDHNCLSVFFWGFPVSLLSPVMVLVNASPCLFRGSVSVLFHTTTHICWRSCYCLLSGWWLLKAFCVCLRQGSNWFEVLSVFVSVKNLSVNIFVKCSHEMISVRCLVYFDFVCVGWLITWKPVPRVCFCSCLWTDVT